MKTSILMDFRMFELQKHDFHNRTDYKTQSKLLLKELKDMKKKGIGETGKGLYFGTQTDFTFQ